MECSKGVQLTVYRDSGAVIASLHSRHALRIIIQSRQKTWTHQTFYLISHFLNVPGFKEWEGVEIHQKTHALALSAEDYFSFAQADGGLPTSRGLSVWRLIFLVSCVRIVSQCRLIRPALAVVPQARPFSVAS